MGKMGKKNFKKKGGTKRKLICRSYNFIEKFVISFIKRDQSSGPTVNRPFPKAKGPKFEPYTSRS